MARGRFNKNRARGGGGRGRGRGGGGGGGGNRSYQDTRQSFADVDKTNENLEKYYNTISIVPAGSEREKFWSTLRRELPNSFRFTGSRAHAVSVQHNLTTRFFPLISKITHEGQNVALPEPIPWYPDGLAYSMKTPKNVVRKYESFKDFQKFLVSETNVGNISRQEQVSMIPPLLLDVRPDHAVLDLCAAPGSKSAQLIEAIHAGEEEKVERAIALAKGKGPVKGVAVEEDGMQDCGRTIGLLVANDVNYQRAQMLVHQVKRLNSPNLIVTNHDATHFPSIELPTPPPGPGQRKVGKYLKFDRILADVPCSGDGTCRKNPSIWKEWNPQNGLGLYITQVRILTRALQMLKVGGRVVYSTCSMNPVENEAVVSSAIERCEGVAKVKLLDCSDQLPTLFRSPGLEDWSIMARDGSIYESYPEAVQREPEGSKVVPGMFAPDAKERIPLRHCMRVYPHQQDTGAFFIAVLEKLSEIRAKPEEESKSAKKDWSFTSVQESQEGAPRTNLENLLDEDENLQTSQAKKGDLSSAPATPRQAFAGAGTKRKASEEDDEVASKKAKVANTKASDEVSMEDTNGGPLPPNALLSSDPTNASLQNGTTAVSSNTDSAPAELQPPPRRRRKDNEPAIEESFKYLSPTHPELASIYEFYALHPAFPRDRFLVRNPNGDPVKGIYYSSELVKDILQANEGRGMKFVHAGVKMFMKQDVQGQEGVCRWRVQVEGLPIIEGWVGDNRVVRLRQRETLRRLLVEMFPKITTAKASGLGEIGEQVREMGMGCCILRVETSEMEVDGEEGFTERMTLPLWRSLHSLNLMLPKEERKAMLLRLFNEDSELVNHHADTKVQKENEKMKAEENGSGSAREQAVGGSEDGGAEVGVAAVAGGNAALEVVAAEQDSLAEKDILRGPEGEEREQEGEDEDEEMGIAKAMPEKEVERDEIDTTV